MATYHIAPAGLDTNTGAIGSPFRTIQKAHDIAVPGDFIYARGGTYTYTVQQTLTRSGSALNLITLCAYPGETPVFDAIGMSSGWIIRLTSANYWYIKGLELKGTPSCVGGGIWVADSNDVKIELNNVHHCGLTGILFTGACSNAIVLNNDVHHNRDDVAIGGNYSDADGIRFSTLGGTAGEEDLTQLGTAIARVTVPTGSGNTSLAIIRDGDRPPIDTSDSLRQYDTYDGANTAVDDWIGYTYPVTYIFDRVVFQEGRHFADGGWFTTLTVQVLQSGVWNAVSGLTTTPAYPGINNATTFETYTLEFDAIEGDGIRIFGNPGGSADFISVGELEVFAPAVLPFSNVIRGNRCWLNANNGVDLAESVGVLAEGNWAWLNGFDNDIDYNTLGEGTGFKVSGTGLARTTGGHKIQNNLSWWNHSCGFSDGLYADDPYISNDIFHNTTLQNDAADFFFINQNNAKNNLAHFNVAVSVAGTNPFNSWTLGVTVSTADFESIDFSGATGSRQADGSLPILNFLKLVAGSDLRGAGTEVGFGLDLGAYQYTTITVPAVLTVGASSVQGTNVASLSWAHNNTGNLLFVGVDTSNSSPFAITGVTYNGVAMTPIWNFFAQVFFRNAGFYMLAPPIGTYQVVATWAGTNAENAAGAISVSGAHATNPIVTFVTASGNSATASVAIAASADELVIDNVQALRPALTVDAAQTQRWQQANIPPGPCTGAGSTEPGPSTVSSWSLGAAAQWLMGAVVIRGAGLSATSVTRDANVIWSTRASRTKDAEIYWNTGVFVPGAVFPAAPYTPPPHVRLINH